MITEVKERKPRTGKLLNWNKSLSSSTTEDGVTCFFPIGLVIIRYGDVSRNVLMIKALHGVLESVFVLEGVTVTPITLDKINTTTDPELKQMLNPIDLT